MSKLKVFEKTDCKLQILIKIKTKKGKIIQIKIKIIKGFSTLKVE